MPTLSLNEILLWHTPVQINTATFISWKFLSRVVDCAKTRRLNERWQWSIAPSPHLSPRWGIWRKVCESSMVSVCLSDLKRCSMNLNYILPLELSVETQKQTGGDSGELMSVLYAWCPCLSPPELYGRAQCTQTCLGCCAEKQYRASSCPPLFLL